MAPLGPELRRDLERAVLQAREVAERGARASLAVLGVEAPSAPAALSQPDRHLRVALRTRAQSIGGGDLSLGIGGLVEEIAYEQWHRMLFARFLAENGLLLHPEGAPVSLADVEDLAAEEGEPDPWVLAARYAAAMLPGIFRADDPAHQVRLAPEHRTQLESVLAALPPGLFTADDALGWVYQFWQSERKDEVNRKGDKIGSADLSPVTQLFTEHYMVRFLLENSLGAWWAGRHADSPLLRDWEYLRYRDDGTPAAGTFEGWAARVAEVTVMDPCCGSGHFLTAAADMLRRMREEEEGLTAAQAAAAVLRDNLFGLELDARCVQLAAFNLALDAWRAGGYQPLPVPNLACTGIAIRGQRADWARLAGGDGNMAGALDRLYDLFQDAPELGSLIDPRAAAGEGLWAVDPDQLLEKLDQALRREAGNDPAAAVFGAAAAGTAKAAQLLGRRYSLVATNPPFLARGKHGARLRSFAADHIPDSAQDLALMFVERWLGVGADSVACVSPHSWLFLGSFESLRRHLLEYSRLLVIGRMGTGAFQAISGEIVNVALAILQDDRPSAGSQIQFVSVENVAESVAKASALRLAPLRERAQASQLANPDARISVEALVGSSRLGDFVRYAVGIQTNDNPRALRAFWEGWTDGASVIRYEMAPDDDSGWSGRSWIGHLPVLKRIGRLTGFELHGHAGVVVNPMSLRVGWYAGDPYDQSAVVLVPMSSALLPAVMAYCASDAFRTSVQALDQQIKVTPATLTKVPFDLEDWSRVAAEDHPDGLPQPHSDDPTQWLFKGNVVGSADPLHVAVARLLGYRWPDQEPDELDDLADADGLVPLVSVAGERPAAERLRALLARAYGDLWSPAQLDRLLAGSGSPGRTLEAWLRDDFFAQHVRLFANRPFIWHVWDGRRDGFSTLCHYHRLDRARLERLTYTLLGDWIERQRAAGDEPGAEDRLTAALKLQGQLTRILEGEAPYDVYVRWKALPEQPLSWEPDLDDGVRLNIRPFVTAGVLRSKVNVKWEKDRGKNPDGSDRINDLHPTLAEKRAARERAR